MTLQEQQDITHRLVAKLEAIRDECKEEVKVPSELAQCFSSGSEKLETLASSDSQDCDPDLEFAFVESMKMSSNGCTERMKMLAAEVLSMSVNILNSKPPCGFVAVAIGSIARGEATPYSDLEYIFLIEDSGPIAMAYFERLAITSYFLIGNLGETKLSYMAIGELEGWYDDCAKNGFKIDGLAKGAGNIPTGNCEEGCKNKFIKTPAELLEMYRKVLNQPETQKALTGDLTAMLNYMTPIYSFTNGLTLLVYLQAELGQVIPNEARQEINVAMLQADMKKFNFVPDSQLAKQGFTMNVKKQIFRFPSILLYDLSIIHRCVGHSSWETLDLLYEFGHISSSVYSTLSLLLACACFMRLSAYLTHDSHNDMISVGLRRPVSVRPGDLHVPSPCRRWFVPDCLFYTLCYRLIPLQEYLSTCGNIRTTLSKYTSTYNPLHANYTHAKILWACGRIGDLLHIRSVLDNNLSAEEELRFEHAINSYMGSELTPLLHTDSYSDSGSKEEYETELPAGGIGLSQVEPSDQSQKWLEKQLNGVDYKIDRWEYYKAKKMLDKISFHNAEVDYRYGLIHSALSQYDKAEQYLTKALQEFHNQSCREQLYDYYGDPVVYNERMEELEDISHISNTCL